MKIPTSIFRQYDIRGVVDDELTPNVAHAVGRALSTWTQARMARPPRIVVGRDNRPSGGLLSHAVRDGIAHAGGTAVDVGMVPTPALYLAIHELDVDGGLQVTGSHNPPEFNGFKMVAAGQTLYGADIEELRRLIETDETNEGAGSFETDGGVTLNERPFLIGQPPSFREKARGEIEAL